MNTNLSAETIEAMLIGKFAYEERLSGKYSQRIQNALGMSAPVSSESIDLSRQLKTVMAGSMAKKLVANDRSVSLFSVDECDQLISDYLDKKFEEDARKEAVESFCTPEMDQENVDKLVNFALKNGLCGVDDEEKKIIKDITKPMINGMVEAVMALVGDYDPYDRYLEIIGTIEFLANEQMLPLEQPLPDELYDEVTRRIYTKEEYTALNEKGLNLVSDPNTLLKTLMKPMIDSMLSEVAPESAAEIRVELEEQLEGLVSAQFAPMFEKLREVAKEVVTEETNRLYPQ